MTDLKDRLDMLAREATSGVTLMPADLAAHLRRRYRRRLRAGGAALVSLSVLVAIAVAYWPPPQHSIDVATSPSSLNLAQRPTSTVPADAKCTAADPQAPKVTIMPTPTVVTQTVTIDPSPNLQQLTPPDGQSKISAALAWATMNAVPAFVPVSTGPVALLLGDLNSNYAHSSTLVWALYSQHQAVIVQGNGVVQPSATTTAVPCGFLTTVIYVDAMTGQTLSNEAFAPGPAAPGSPLSNPTRNGVSHAGS